MVRRKINDYEINLKLKHAVQCILDGDSFKNAYRLTGIAQNTIKKYYLKYMQSQDSNEIEFIFKNKLKGIPEDDEVFTPGQVESLIECLKYFESLFYGLSEKECRMLAYQTVVKEDLKIPNDWKQSMASVKWLLFFKQRHLNLNLAKPHRCRLHTTSRNMVWEKTNISKFYENLERLVKENPVFNYGTRIFSLDETYASIDPKKLMASRDAQKDLLTICFIINACGTALPPVIIRPQKMKYKVNSEVLPPETLTFAASRGRLTWDLFPNIMQHFITHSNSSLENPSILIMDIDICHLSIDAFNMAKMSGVHIITLHTHISKQLQPLEVGIFSLFHKFYNASMKSWLKGCRRKSSERKIYSEIGKFVNEAYVKTMKSENVQNAFKSCGIFPFDRDIFNDSEYLSRLMTGKPCYECRARHDSGRKPIARKPVEVVKKEADGPSTDVQEETLAYAATSEDSNQTEKENQTPQSDGKSLPPNSSSNETGTSGTHEENDRHGDEREMSQQQKRNELDKLKRRMIRTVARLLKEKKTDDEVWEELKKESGSNCKKLWDRMRSLTMKKLKRLLDAHDRVELVPSVARMTLTDWLLYDLVIVHEKIDVIDRKRLTDNKVLNDLFALVQRFMIEGREGDDLAEAWTAATISYNSKSRQCSPMLLQRRWYQLKELTRDKLYKFWFDYRGNERLLENAKQHAPTQLQKAIALRYPDIITKPFPDWEERIEKKLVIMPEEFEVKMRKKSIIKPSDENAPDVVIVENKIDTITIGDSDSESYSDENSRESNAVPQNTDTEDDETPKTPKIVEVKIEPQDDNIDIIDHWPYQSEEPKDRFEEEIERLMIEEDKIFTDKLDTTDVETSQVETESEDCMMPRITDVKGAVDTEKEYIQNDALISYENLENMDNKLRETVEIEKAVAIEYDSGGMIVDEKELEIVENNFNVSVNTVTIEKNQTVENEQANNKELEIIEDNFDEHSQEPILIDHNDEIIPLKHEAQEESNSRVTSNKDFDISPEVKKTRAMKANRNYSFSAENDDSVNLSDPILAENYNLINISDHNNKNEFCPIITAADKSSHFETKMEIDTSFSFFEEENVDEVIPNVLQDAKYSPTGEIAKYSPLLEPTVDLTDEAISEMNFADDGIEFADDGIEYFDDEYRNEMTETNRAIENHADENNGAPKFDLKLLMNPVVYTTKLDEMSIYQDRSLFDTIDEKELVDKIIFESKPISSKSIKVDKETVESGSANEVDDTVQVKVENQENQDTNEVDDDLFHNDSSDESDSDVIDDSKKVKLSSNLLQKPRSRSYNPIQLCKNPDFNTRLKRLTVGFFSSSRNRVFLKACKPMTIDLSKAFESKLIDGTMYLKPSDQTTKSEIENISEAKAVSILPSAVAVQSLMDTHTSDVDIILQEELKKRMLERKKVINLPNISVVRQMNQQLLMVEVAPIMAQSNKSATAQIKNIDQNVKTGENVFFLNQVQNSEHTNDPNSCNGMLKVRDECHNNIEIYTNSNDTKKPANVTLTNSTQSLPVADSSDNNKSKADKALEKLKRRQERLKIQNMKIPSWISKKTTTTTNDANSESLLTLDTLYKVLNALDPRVVQCLPTKQHKKKIRLKKAQTKNLLSDEVDETDKIDKKQKTPFVLGSDKNKKRACCWARTKIDKMNSTLPSVRLNKHRCPEGNCKCCCKELLRQLQIDFEVKILENMQKYSDNIDNVTKVIDQNGRQSQRFSNVTEPPLVKIVNVYHNAVGTNSKSLKKISVDIGLQADMDEYDSVHVINNTPEVTVKETNTEPEVSAGEKEVEEVTIDLVGDEVNVPALSKKQSPKPKIRLHTGNIPLKWVKRNAPTVKPNIPPKEPKPRTVMPKLAAYNKPVTTPFKCKLKSKESVDESEQSLPCSCRPNVLVDQSSAMLIIDGSTTNTDNDCVRHNKSRVSKETRIYLNRKHMSATERPFYVGKNKILLTNIKQLKPQPPPPEPLPMSLPDGVQVVMLPDGTITYIVNPTIELTPEHIAAMPAILSAVQAQIKAAGITMPIPAPGLNESCETINLEDNVVQEPVDAQHLKNSEVEDEKNKESNSANEKVLPTASLDSQLLDTLDVQNVKDDVSTTSVSGQLDLQNEFNQETSSNEAAKAVSEVVENTNKVSDNTLSANHTSDNKEHMASYSIETKTPVCLTEPDPTTNAKNPDIAGNEHNYAQESPEKNGTIASSETVNSNKKAANASRNLLSDLMEMSGILEEDVAPIQQDPIIKQHSIITPPETMSQPIMLQVPELSLSQPGLIPVPELSPFDKREHSISAQINDKIHELNPITSFAELKYSCDNDGLFFKLDLTNGIIVPINVCIQKTPSESVSLRTNQNPVEVIDLTDEQGVSINEDEAEVSPTRTDNVKHSFKITPRRTSTMMTIIPSPDKNSILKNSSPTSFRFPIEQKKQALLNKLSNNLKPLKILQRQKQHINILRKSFPTGGRMGPLKRNFNLDKVEAKINLVDSETPMLEEYLVEDSSDDSDDEPLATVAKKMRLTDGKCHNQESDHGPPNEQKTQNEPVSQEKPGPVLLHGVETIDFEEAIDAIASIASSIEPPELLRPSVGNVGEPVPTQLVVTGGSLNQPIHLNQSFLASNEMECEDSQDDCILGV